MHHLLCALILAAAPQPQTWHRAVGLLEYLEGDYGNALASGDQGELEEQRGLAEEVVKQLATTPYRARAEEIHAAITASAPSAEVASKCAALARTIIGEQHVVRAPREVPSLELGKQHYGANCAACHGLDGAANTPAAKALTPPPADFLDAQRMSTLTPYKVFNTSTFVLLCSRCVETSTFGS